MLVKGKNVTNSGMFAQKKKKILRNVSIVHYLFPSTTSYGNMFLQLTNFNYCNNIEVYFLAIIIYRTMTY